MTNKKDKGVEVIPQGNKLKRKIMGSVDEKPGYIDPQAIEKAEELVDGFCLDCEATIESLFAQLKVVWKTMRDTESKEGREKISQEIFLLAHEIKDVAALCKRNLTAYFGESLRDYIEKADIGFKEQMIIVQAHMDAMQAAESCHIKDELDPKAEELKEAVKKAIAQYS